MRKVTVGMVLLLLLALAVGAGLSAPITLTTDQVRSMLWVGNQAHEIYYEADWSAAASVVNYIDRIELDPPDADPITQVLVWGNKQADPAGRRTYACALVYNASNTVVDGARWVRVRPSAGALDENSGSNVGNNRLDLRLNQVPGDPPFSQIWRVVVKMQVCAQAGGTIICPLTGSGSWPDTLPCN